MSLSTSKRKFHSHKQQARLAFSLIELLVVIAIVAILLSLIIVAVQKARSSAARLACSNNLRQIGLALHQYHEQRGAFPPGVSINNECHPEPFLGWTARILPYLEQEQLWREIQRSFRQDKNFLHRPPHLHVSTVIKVYACPSVPEAQQPHPQHNVAFTSYLGVEGHDQFTLDGTLFYDSRVALAEITDGTSHVLMVGERPPSPDGKFGWWYAGHGQEKDGSAEMILGVRETCRFPEYLFDCTVGPYHFIRGDEGNPCSTFHFWSRHPGGANFLFADGSVRFLRYELDPLMPALASRAGGEPSID